MKKIEYCHINKIVLLIVLLLLDGIAVIAQAQPRAYGMSRQSSPAVTYDSTYNINNIRTKSISDLIGQSFYFIPNQRCEKQGHYNITLVKKLPDRKLSRFSKDLLDLTYNPISIDVGYGHFDTYTSYEALQDKSFEIVDHIPSNDKHYEYLVLRSPQTEENLFLECHQPMILSPFVVILGYYEKLKSLVSGKEYKPITDVLIQNFDTGKFITVSPKDTMTCVDVLFVDEPFDPEVLLLESKDRQLYCFKYNKFSSSFLDIAASRQGKIDWDEIQREREKEMIPKYGKVNGKAIARYEVKIGFTKAMCIDAWGEPDHINKTTTKFGTSEQWVYNKSYLYFENGRLTAIQE